MRNITVRDILRVTGGSLILMEEEGKAEPETKKQVQENGSHEIQTQENRVYDRELTDLCVNSKLIKEGDLFIPLPGEKTDGHKYMAAALEKAGASLCSWDVRQIYPDEEQLNRAKVRGDILIHVEDTQKALEEIGAYIRTQYEPPVVAVTGSVGKTTTRRMIATALGSSREVYETPENYNSRIGLPITTSRMLDKPSEAAVLEMGIDRIGEMDIEYAIARPEIAVVTMIGVCHMEYLGSREGIRKEKLKIAGPDTVLFLNRDDAMLAEMKGRVTAKEVWYYGLSPEADYRAEDVSMVEGAGYGFTYVHGDHRIKVTLPVMGEHNVRNALVAMAICDYLDLPLDRAAEALGGFQSMRQLIRRSGSGITVIDDVYNASPDSMRAALSVLSEMHTEGKKWAVLGDMFELGSREKEFHGEVGDGFASYSVDRLVTVGALAEELGRHAKAAKPELVWDHFSVLEEAEPFVKESLGSGDTVLFKASHGMHFEKLVHAICVDQ